jgi:hypothetical protein
MTAATPQSLATGIIAQTDIELRVQIIFVYIVLLIN